MSFLDGAQEEMVRLSQLLADERAESASLRERLRVAEQLLEGREELRLQAEAESASLRKRVAEADKDYAEMRKFQKLYIDADHGRLAAEARLRALSGSSAPQAPDSEKSEGSDG